MGMKIKTFTIPSKAVAVSKPTVTESYPGHPGKKGQRGGSAPRGGGGFAKGGASIMGTPADVYVHPSVKGRIGQTVPYFKYKVISKERALALGMRIRNGFAYKK